MTRIRPPSPLLCVTVRRAARACARLPRREDAYRVVSKRAVTPLPPSARLHRVRLGCTTGSAPLPLIALVERSSAVVLVDSHNVRGSGGNGGGGDNGGGGGMLEVLCVERKASIAPGMHAAEAARPALVVALDAVHLEVRDLRIASLVADCLS